MKVKSVLVALSAALGLMIGGSTLADENDAQVTDIKDWNVAGGEKDEASGENSVTELSVRAEGGTDVHWWKISRVRHHIGRSSRH